MTQTPDITVEHTGLALVKPLLADYLAVCYRLPEDERRQWSAFSDGGPFDPEAMAIQLAASPGPRWALVTSRGEPIAIGGFTWLRPRVWQDWLISTSAAWTDHWRTVSKTCRRIIDRMLATEARRIQCVALAERTRAHAWYRVLGYEREGLLRAYGAHGEDAVMFARVAQMEERTTEEREHGQQ